MAGNFLAPNLLDRLVLAVAPERGLRRLAARTAIEQLGRLPRAGRRSAYDGAKSGRRTEGWVAAGAGVNGAVGQGLALLRQRSHDLVRNSPYAGRALDIITDNAVGTGVMPRAATSSAARNKRLDQLWARWAPLADVAGRASVYALQAEACSAMLESGAALLRPRRRRVSAAPSDRMPADPGVPLRLQLLEPDHIDLARSSLLTTTGSARIVQGVEFDADGRRLAYWLFPDHPGDGFAGFGRLTAQRVAAEDVHHVFVARRPGQVHGVPHLAPVMLKLRDLDDYEEAELVRKKIEACFAAFVTQSEDPEADGAARVVASSRSETEETADGGSEAKRIETLEPGMIEYLRPGEKIEFSAPAASSDYVEYVRANQRIVALGAGVPYELLTGDLSQVNYSSIRAGLLEFRRRIERLRWQTLTPLLLSPIWVEFVQACFLAGLVDRPEADVIWTFPKFEAVDPQKDAEADLTEIRAGLVTWDEAVAKRGYDPREQLERIKAHQDTLDRLGIVLESDPRRARSAAAQPAANPAADQDAKPATDGGEPGSSDEEDDPKNPEADDA